MAQTINLDSRITDLPTELQEPICKLQNDLIALIERVEEATKNLDGLAFNALNLMLISTGFPVSKNEENVRSLTPIMEKVQNEINAIPEKYRELVHRKINIINALNQPNSQLLEKKIEAIMSPQFESYKEVYKKLQNAETAIDDFYTSLEKKLRSLINDPHRVD